MKISDEDYEMIKRIVPLAKEKGIISKATITNLFMEYLLAQGVKQIMRMEESNVKTLVDEEKHYLAYKAHQYNK